jgi:hypothetical protein
VKNNRILFWDGKKSDKDFGGMTGMRGMRV